MPSSFCSKLCPVHFFCKLCPVHFCSKLCPVHFSCKLCPVHFCCKLCPVHFCCKLCPVHFCCKLCPVHFNKSTLKFRDSKKKLKQIAYQHIFLLYRLLCFRGTTYCWSRPCLHVQTKVSTLLCFYAAEQTEEMLCFVVYVTEACVQTKKKTFT